MEKWICTDIDTEQYGKQLGEFLFLFKEKNRDEEAINVSAYTNGVIEGVINSYGYTLKKSRKQSKNIFELYGKQANWIIAECLFEMEM